MTPNNPDPNNITGIRHAVNAKRSQATVIEPMQSFICASSKPYKQKSNLKVWKRQRNKKKKPVAHKQHYNIYYTSPPPEKKPQQQQQKCYKTLHTTMKNKKGIPISGLWSRKCRQKASESVLCRSILRIHKTNVNLNLFPEKNSIHTHSVLIKPHLIRWLYSFLPYCQLIRTYG